MINLIAGVVFVALLARLYMVHMGRSNGGGAKGQGANSKEPQKPIGIAEEPPRDQVSALLFWVLLACIVLPILFPGWTAKDATTAAKTLTVYIERDGVRDIAKQLANAPDIEFVVGLVDLSDELNADTTLIDLKETCKTFLKRVQRAQLGVNKVVIGSFRNQRHYSALNAAIDIALVEFSPDGTRLQVHAVHGFGDFSPEANVQGAAERCLMDETKCFHVLEGAVAPDFRPNDVIRSVILNISEEIGRVKPAEKTAKKTKSIIPEPVSIEQEEPREFAQEQVATPSVEGPSVIKRLFLLFTKILGFVYPLHETVFCLAHKEGNASEWTAYWLIFAFMCFVEESLLVHLVLLMPLYLIGKVLFIVWCIWPDAANSMYAVSRVKRTLGL
mmetsp:Transcript_3303/g.4777  ORF Transcript_3303/g.4777 Transcript_3303/m.4777 type:complete len:387 (+) Transcript_3303:1424-2584(+)